MAVSPQAKDRLFKSVSRYLTDFAVGECPRDFELTFVAEISRCVDYGFCFGQNDDIFRHWRKIW